MRFRHIGRVGFTFLLAGMIAGAVHAQRPGRKAGEKYALLVGVRKYDPNELRALPFTEPDVTELADVLKQRGYRPGNIVLMTQTAGVEDDRFAPRGPNIRKELTLLLDGLDESDSVLVALAGHGVQFRGDPESYFCPADAHLADKRSLIGLGEVYKALEQSRAGLKVLLVDACRNDPQSENSRARSVVNLESVTRPPTQAPPGGVVAFFSCSAGQKAYEHSELKHGVFFHFVIEAMRGEEADFDKDRFLAIEELALYAKRRVRDFVREKYGESQLPELKGTTRDLVSLVSLGASEPLSPIEKVIGDEASLSVVRIVAKKASGDPPRSKEPELASEGSMSDARTGAGFVYSSKGYILTNYHVVEGSDKITVTFHDGETNTALLVGVDPDIDLAVLRVKAAGYRPLPLVDDRTSLRAGQRVLALGSPPASNRKIKAASIRGADHREIGINECKLLIRINTTIDPGNSGVPLVDLQGRVIGIMTANHPGPQPNSDAGSAISMSIAAPIADKLIEVGRFARPRLGVVLKPLTPALAKQLGLDPKTEGALVSQAAPSSPAEEAGLKPGDVLTGFKAVAIVSVLVFRLEEATSDVNKPLDLKYLRDGKEERATVVLAPSKQG